MGVCTKPMSFRENAMDRSHADHTRLGDERVFSPTSRGRLRWTSVRTYIAPPVSDIATAAPGRFSSTTPDNICSALYSWAMAVWQRRRHCREGGGEMDGWSAGQVVKDRCPPEYQSPGDARPSPPANGSPSAGGVPRPTRSVPVPVPRPPASRATPKPS